MTTNELEGLWLSVTELAAARNKDKGTVSRRVSKLEADGLLTTRRGPGGSKLVNAAAFDRASGESVDAIRELAGRGDPGRRGAGKILAHEQARRVAYQADLAELELNERLGNLLPVDRVIEVVAACAETVLLTLEQLPARAEEISAAVGKDGPHGARAVLKAFTFDVRRTVERAMADLDAKGIAAHTAEAGT